MSQDRKLAAVMFTDIVGYTSLMGSDEDREFETLCKNREIQTNLIELLQGRMIENVIRCESTVLP